WHFVHLRERASAAQLDRLRELLTYGPAARGERIEDDLLLVVPRLGTISPWASKATDIARHCGLETVERIERGTAYRFESVAVRELGMPQRNALLSLIHD